MILLCLRVDIVEQTRAAVAKKTINRINLKARVEMTDVEPLCIKEGLASPESGAMEKRVTRVNEGS
jgi:hypothetical protein